ncbi:hypothetical protein [Xanthomonas arboricola]|uniref:hypothetical protein n=1 Tax=Xanthomonas arboricola TaxID=56448 RepID=UPI0011B020F1|nr:hypothetical protein [Xanthomonas arboricola]
MHKDSKKKIAAMLISAAKSNGTCSFARVFEFFQKGIDKNIVFKALEDAASSIAPPELANYTSLMALGNTNFPGDGFFNTFKIKRSAEYEEIAGGSTPTLKLSLEQKAEITSRERSRVYNHAASLP